MVPGVVLKTEIAYGNHSNSESRTEAIRAKVVQDVVNGRALAFKRSSVSGIRGLRVPLLDVVEDRKLRIIHELTFACDDYRSSVSHDTDFSTAPPYELGHVLGDVSRQIMYLDQRYGVARVMLCRIDVKDAFRQIPVDPLHAAKLGYVFDEYAVADLFLQFRGRSSPGYWDLVVSPLEYAHNQTSFQNATVSEHGRSAGGHVRVDVDAGRETMPVPPNCERVPSAGVVAGSPDAGRETIPIPPDCEREPDSGSTASVTDTDWEMMPIPPDRTHTLGAGVAAGTPGPDRETIPISSDYERLLVTAVTPSTLSLCGFTLTMVLWSRCISFKTGASCDLL